jgi:ribosomal protein L37E
MIHYKYTNKLRYDLSPVCSKCGRDFHYNSTKVCKCGGGMIEARSQYKERKRWQKKLRRSIVVFGYVITLKK